MTTFGTGYSDWDAAEKTWAEAKDKRDARNREAAQDANREAASHGDPFSPAIGRLTPEVEVGSAWERIEQAALDYANLTKLGELAIESVTSTPEETALADAREVISDTLFELRFVIGALEADKVVMVNVPQVRATLRGLYKDLNRWANDHDLSPVDFAGRNDEELEG